MKYASIYRGIRQQQIGDWCVDAFGPMAIDPGNRARRIVEEAIELAQAEGVSGEDIVKIAEHVYGRPVGDPDQEVGGVAVTLLAYCAATGRSAESLERREVERILNKDVEHFRRRNAEKVKAGI
jgi:hypothetical protein